MAFARRSRRSLVTVAALLAVAVAAALHAQAPVLPSPQRVTDGVRLYRWQDPALLEPAGPVDVHLLRLDARKARVRLAAASVRAPGKATVAAIASRHQALAAVNAGFFVVATGAPAGLLKIDRRLVAPAKLPRGAVGIQRGSLFHRPRLVFDQVAASLPASAAQSPRYTPRLGTPVSAWEHAADIVGGAGLLVHAGRELAAEDWAAEQMRDGFTTERHPRTMIGVDAVGAIWLIAVDGRNAQLSLGMTFAELQGLARRLSLSEALNLDGGGSTTMVVEGRIVNRPSDATGPRPVSDALLVFAR